MGFRDMHSFYLAMLAKQVWRLLLEPNSLCARVLRAKYRSVQESLELNITQMVSFSEPRLRQEAHSLGRVFLRDWNVLRRVIYMESE